MAYHQQAPRQCRFFGVARGCLRGDACTFLHGAPNGTYSQQGEATGSGIRSRRQPPEPSRRVPTPGPSSGPSPRGHLCIPDGKPASPAGPPAIMDIPGYYYDEGKGKYFRLLPGTKAPSRRLDPDTGAADTMVRRPGNLNIPAILRQAQRHDRFCRRYVCRWSRFAVEFGRRPDLITASE